MTDKGTFFCQGCNKWYDLINELYGLHLCNKCADNAIAVKNYLGKKNG